MEIHVGVDWARYGGVAVAVVAEREYRIKYDRSAAGLDKLVARLRELGPGCVVRVAVEAGDRSLAVLLGARGVVVHVVDPKQAKRHAESLRSSRAKDDVRDARNLARMAQSEVHRGAVFALPEAKREALELVLSELEASGNRQQRLVNQVRAKLVDCAPALDAALGDLTTQRALALIEMAPTATHGRVIDEGAWQSFCRAHRVHMKDRQRLFDAIRAPWRDLPPAVEAVVAKQIRLMVQELRAATASRDAVDEMIAELMRDEPHARRLETIHGIGTTLAATLTLLGVAEAANRDELAVLAGVAPVTIQSGNSRVVTQRIELSSTARRAAFLIGVSAARWLPWGRAMYADGRARGQRHAHAVRRVGRSLLRIIHSMLTKQTDYDDARYVASLKARGVKWAAALGNASNVADAA